MYTLFGKHWVKWDMIEGYKMAIFVNEAEIQMEKDKLRTAEEKKAKLEADMVALKNSPLADPLTLLSPDQAEDKREVQKMEYKLKQEREEQLEQFKAQIKSAETEIQMADGSLSKVYAIAYSNRVKYDFMKNYKITDTYADKNK